MRKNMLNFILTGVCVFAFFGMMTSVANLAHADETSASNCDGTCSWLGGVTGCAAGSCNVQGSCECTGTTGATCSGSCDNS